MNVTEGCLQSMAKHRSFRGFGNGNSAGLCLINPIA
jgi:hypothetical protein